VSRDDGPPTVRRRVRLPDPARLERCRRLPELGPEVLFFSGGTALRATSAVLTEYTHNSVHLITPFDSGGSSAVLRRALGMIAVGDLRNRLMALADRESRGHPEVYRLFGWRLGRDEPRARLEARLADMVSGEDPLVAAVPSPLRRLVRTHLARIVRDAPPDMDWRGASIGNLVLAGGYLETERDVDAVLFLFSRLVQVRGLVRPVVDADLHLVAELADRALVLGQHRITGREVPPLETPIRELRLSSSLDREVPATARVDAFTQRAIARADVIVFPPGSFFTSVMACLLPQGVGAAVVAAGCPRVYVPNPGSDPEELGWSVADRVCLLDQRLRADAGGNGSAPAIDIVLVDRQRGRYPAGLDVGAIERMGVRVLDTPLLARDGQSGFDPELLAQAVVSLT
jgi:CofD-related protein of GAK system